MPEVARLHAENYGRRKMHALLKRQGWDIGRDQTEHLMRTSRSSPTSVLVGSWAGTTRRRRARKVLPLQALDMAAWGADGPLDGLIHHADHGSNHMSMVSTNRVVERGAPPSRGTVGDSYDNALAEAVNNLDKTELIRQRGPWRTLAQVELTTLERVWWWNHQRLHGELGMRTPIEIEDAYYADLESGLRRPPDRETDRNETQADSR